MKQELTEKQKKFFEATKKHQQEMVEKLAYEVLATSLRENVPVFDLPYYILQKAKQQVLEAFNKTNFRDKKVIKARKALAKECLAKVKENVPKQEKKEVKDETDERDNRCIPIVDFLVELLLSEDLIFSDEKYFDVVLENEESIPLSSAIDGYISNLDEKLLMVISEHWKRANDELWGIEKEKVTFEQMDAVLKKIK